MRSILVLMFMLMLVVESLAGWDVNVLPAGDHVEYRAGYSVKFDWGKSGGIDVDASDVTINEGGAGGGSADDDTGFISKVTKHLDRNKIKYIAGVVAGGVVVVDRWAEKNDTLWYDWKWALEGKSSDDKVRSREKEIREDLERRYPWMTVKDIHGSTITVDYDYTKGDVVYDGVLVLENINNSIIHVNIRPAEIEGEIE